MSDDEQFFQRVNISLFQQTSHTNVNVWSSTSFFWTRPRILKTCHHRQLVIQSKWTTTYKQYNSKTLITFLLEPRWTTSSCMGSRCPLRITGRHPGNVTWWHTVIFLRHRSTTSSQCISSMYSLRATNASESVASIVTRLLQTKLYRILQGNVDSTGRKYRTKLDWVANSSGY